MTDQNHDETQISTETPDTDVVQDAEIESQNVEAVEITDDQEAEVVTEEEADKATSNSDETKTDDQLKTDDQPKAKEKEIDWKDSYVRLAADFDNYRKRTNKELDDARKRAREGVIKEWLDVYDNTERAIAALPEKEGVWYDGFQAILKQMDGCLAKFGIKPVDDVGTKFDPKRHEAIQVCPNPNLENDTIMYVEKRGFIYENGDVARVARVIVVRNPS